MIVHDFRESLEKSHSYFDAPWWDDVYRKAFPGFASSVSVRDDGWAQRGGIDRVITLKSGKTITVDEKIREKDWPDILLERWSDAARHSPGWIQKSLACDYIAYAFVPSHRCYLLPFLSLRKAWIKNGPDWIDSHPTVSARNRDYTTESIAVPIDELMAALSDAMRVEWSDA